MTSSSTSTSAVFSAYRSQWGLTTADIAVAFSVYVGTLLPVLLIFGGLADRIGRRRVVTAGILFMVTGMIALTLAHGLPALLVARGLQGIGAGLAGGALSAAFSESYRGKIPVGHALQCVTAIGLAVGPVITAIAFDLGGGANRSYLPMLVLAVAILGLTPFLDAPASRIAAVATNETPLTAAAVRAGLRFAMPLVFVSWGSLSLYLSLVPSYLAGALHIANPLLGAGAFVASQLASLSATTRLGGAAPERIGVIAPFIVLAGLILLVAGTTGNAWPLIVVATILVGAGGGASSAASFAIAGRVGRGQRARIFARLFVAAYLGYSLPSLATGIIAVHSSLTVGLICVIAAIAVIIAVLPLLRERPAAPACARAPAVSAA
jgi:MFS family permease